MHMLESHKDEAAREAAQTEPPFGPGFSQEEANNIVRLEVWGSSFDDPGEDFVKFIGYSQAGDVVVERQVAGY